jgi:hypothetical protein
VATKKKKRHLRMFTRGITAGVGVRVNLNLVSKCMSSADGKCKLEQGEMGVSFP